MPPLPSPGQVLKVQLVWQIGSDTNCMNVLHYKYSGGPPSAADLTTAAGHMLAICPAPLLAVIPGNTILQECIITDLQGNAGQQGISQSSHPGTDASSQQGASLSVVIGFKVFARYRGGHPRAYFPGMGVTHLGGAQNWNAATLESYRAQVQAWLTAFEGYSLTTLTVGNHCAVSYYNKAITPTPPHLRPTPLVLDVQSYTANPVIGSQRRRLHVG